MWSPASPMSRRFLTRAALLPLLDAMSACSGADYDAPDAGAVILSISAARHLPFSKYIFFYKRKEERPDLRFHDYGRFIWFEEDMFGKPDFEDAHGTGVVRHQRLAPGEYDIFSFSVPRGAPFANIFFSPTKVFSIPFTVDPNASTYIGNFDAREVAGGQFLGLPAPRGVYFILSDQGDRDIPIAERQNAVVGALRKDVPDPIRLGTPLFRAS